MPTPENTTLLDLIDAMDRRPQRGIRFIDTRYRAHHFSYREIFGETLRRARHFLRCGVQRREGVLIAMPTRLDAVSSFLALQWIGAVPHSVASPLLGQDREAHRRRMRQLVRRQQVDWVLASSELEGVVAPEGAEARTRVLPPVEAEEGEDGEEAARIAPAPVDPDETAFVQFSSGSTSDPKGIPITHANLMANLRVIVDNDGRSEESVFVSWLPLYHDMGLVGGLLSNLVFGNALTLMHPRCFIVRPLSFLKEVSEQRATLTAIPNFALDLCLDRIDEEKLRETNLDLSSFRYIYNGAEPVRPEAVRRFETRFAPCGLAPGSIYPVYGMSEMTLIVTAPDPETPLVTRRIDGIEVPSVGRPLGDFTARVRDREGRDLPAGEIGEVWVGGSSLSPGYRPRPAPEDDPFRDGMLATGDLGMLDEEGRLYVTGRCNDLIIHQGRNFYAHDIAASVEELDVVKRGKVFVFDVEEEGATRIVVMTGPPQADLAGALPNEQEYEARIRDAVLREHGLPVDEVMVTSSIPKTTSGKIARHRCRRRYEEVNDSGS